MASSAPSGTMVVPAYARHFGKYQLAARLATGGMAEIFLARLRGLAGFERFVVIKRILPHLDEDENFKSMFIDEARIAARISHPNVCQVYELGEVAGQYYLAMEYLEGVTLNQAMRKLSRERLTPDARLIGGLLMQACEGLHNAHELKDPVRGALNIVHRDVTPHNLFVTVDGLLKVLDFGIAKAQGASSRTRTGTVKGKYAYMPPEQLRGEALDKRTDVWALGVVLFEALTGKRLFWRDTDFLIFRAITDEPIPRVRDFRPDIPQALDDAVAMALTRKKEGRFPSARAFGEAVSEALAPLGGPLSQSAIAAEVGKLFGDEIESHRALVTAALKECDVPGPGPGDDAADDDQSIPLPVVGSPSGKAKIEAGQVADLTAAESPLANKKAGTAPRQVLPLPPPEYSQVSATSRPRPAPSLAPLNMGASADAIDLGLSVDDPQDPPTDPGLPAYRTSNPSGVLPGQQLKPKRTGLIVVFLLLVAGGIAAAIVLLGGKPPEPAAPSAAPDKDPPPLAMLPGSDVPDAAPPPLVADASPPATALPDAGPPPARPDAGTSAVTNPVTNPVKPPITVKKPGDGKRPGEIKRPPDNIKKPPPVDPVPVGPPGYVSVISTPYASIYVDGKYVGDTPLARYELKPGPHRVKAVSAKGTKEFSIKVESGKTAGQRLQWD